MPGSEVSAFSHPVEIFSLLCLHRLNLLFTEPTGIIELLNREPGSGESFLSPERHCGINADATVVGENQSLSPSLTGLVSLSPPTDTHNDIGIAVNPAGQSPHYILGAPRVYVLVNHDGKPYPAEHL